MTDQQKLQKVHEEFLGLYHALEDVTSVTDAKVFAMMTKHAIDTILGEARIPTPRESAQYLKSIVDQSNKSGRRPT